MNKLYNIAPYCARCEKCVYYKHQNESYGCCDYIGVENHSRIFDDKGKHRLKKGTCDVYKERRKNE